MMMEKESDDAVRRYSSTSTADELPQGNQQSEQENKNNSSSVTSWRERLKRWLRDHSKKNDDNYEYSKRVAVAVLALAAMGASYHYRSRRRRKRMSTTTTTTTRQQITASGEKSSSYQSAAIAPLSLLLASMEDGSLRRALLGSTRVFFQTSGDGGDDGTWKRVDLPNSNPAIQKQVLSQVSRLSSGTTAGGGGAEVSVLPERDWSSVLTGVAAALPFVYLALVYRMLRDQVGGRGDGTSSEKNNKTKVTIQTTFRDVAGMDETVTEVSEIVRYLQNPAAYRRLGATAPRGVLLHGPPGCGKTHLARAVAGESGVDSFTACSASEFVELYVGRGAARVRHLFARARAEAIANHRHRRGRRGASRVWQWLCQSTGWKMANTHSGDDDVNDGNASAIIFLDELDALAKTRSGGLLGSAAGSNDEREQTLNQLLTEMDGFYKDEKVTVIVIAATNRADVLDPAIRRRFDRQVRVDYPDKEGRQAILKVHSRHIRTADSVDWAAIAETVGDDSISGADLRNLVNEAALLAVREGEASNERVQQHHLEHAARRIRQMKQWNPTLTL